MASAVIRLAPGAGGPKKLVVKTLQKKDAAAAVEDPLERAWPALRDFLGAVHDTRVTVHSFQELYGAVESLVLAKQCARLYERLVATCSAHIAGIVSGLAAGPGDPAAFLASLQKVWAAHCEQMVVIRNVFLYLDRTYVRDAAAATSAAGAGGSPASLPSGTALLGGAVLPLWDMGLHLLRERLVSFHADVLGRIVSSIVARIAAERRGEAVDRSALASACRMLLALRLYSSHLEQELYADADQSFAAEGVRLLDELDVPTYLIRAEGRLREERDRAAAVLDGSTSLRRLVGIVESQLLARHGSALLERGFASLAEGQRTEDLRRLHALLGRVGRTPEVRKHFADYVKRVAMALVAEESEEKDKALVQGLLDFKARMDALVADAFVGNETFSQALRAGLELAANSRDNKPAELIAKYMDLKLRGGPRLAGVASEEELEALLDRAMFLFRCVHAKDVFEAFYKRDLSKRLLSSRTSSNELERSMVGKLKAECGGQFTAKLEGMFKDADLSRELMSQFASSKEATSGVAIVPAAAAAASSSSTGAGAGAGAGSSTESSSGASAAAAGGAGSAGGSGGLTVDLSVHVLTSSYWPAYTAAPAIVPPHLAANLAAFEAFYGRKFQGGRRLAWQHQLGSCTVKAWFPGNARKEFELSFFQTSVLLLFNGADAVPFPAIAAATGVEDGELRRTLQSLACGKYRVLRKEPKGRDVADSDVFHFNSAFTDPLMRIKIPTIQAVKEVRAEADATREKIMQDRQYQIDAAIVRIMKARKSLPHTQLMSELLGQLRFPGVPADCKKRIDSLIDRDYLERDEADPSVYHYLA